MTKQLAKAFDLLVQQYSDSFGRSIPAGKPGATIDYDRMDIVIDDRLAQMGTNDVDIVTDNGIGTDLVTGSHDTLLQQLAGDIIFFRACVGDRKNSNVNSDQVEFPELLAMAYYIILRRLATRR